MACHNVYAFGQMMAIWKESSSHIPHLGQVPIDSIWCFILFSIVGKPFIIRRQAHIFIFWGTGVYQINCLSSAGLELDAPTNRLWINSSTAKWYTLLVVNISVFFRVPCQKVILLSPVRSDFQDKLHIFKFPECTFLPTPILINELVTLVYLHCPDQI